MTEFKDSIAFKNVRTTAGNKKEVAAVFDRPWRTITESTDWKVPYPPSYVGSPLYKAVLLADKQLVHNLLSKMLPYLHVEIICLKK